MTMFGTDKDKDKDEASAVNGIGGAGDLPGVDERSVDPSTNTLFNGDASDVSGSSAGDEVLDDFDTEVVEASFDLDPFGELDDPQEEPDAQARETRPAFKRITVPGVVVPADSNVFGHRLLTMFPAPVSGWSGIAFGPDGNLYQLANDEVFIWSVDGALLDRWGRHGGELGEFMYAGSLTVMPDGTVYIGERERDLVQWFTPDGAFLGSVDSRTIGAACSMTWEGWPLDPISVSAHPSGSGIFILSHACGLAVFMPTDPDAIPPAMQVFLSSEPFACSASRDGNWLSVIGNEGSELTRFSVHSDQQNRIDFYPGWDADAHSIDEAPDSTLYIGGAGVLRIFWTTPDGSLLGVIPVGNMVIPATPEAARLIEENSGLSHVWWSYDVREICPTSVCTTERDGKIIVAVNIDDGNMVILERDWWDGHPAGEAAAS